MAATSLAISSRGACGVALGERIDDGADARLAVDELQDLDRLLVRQHQAARAP